MKHKWHEVHFTCDTELCCESIIIEGCNNFNVALKRAKQSYPDWVFKMNKVLCPTHEKENRLTANISQ